MPGQPFELPQFLFVTVSVDGAGKPAQKQLFIRGRDPLYSDTQEKLRLSDNGPDRDGPAAAQVIIGPAVKIVVSTHIICPSSNGGRV